MSAPAAHDPADAGSRSGRLTVTIQMRVLLALMVILALLFLGALAVFEWEPYVPSVKPWLEGLPLSPRFVIGALCAAFFLATTWLVKIALNENRRQIAATLAREADARRVEFDARQARLRSEAAVLRLMGELQQVADGDLTVRATASEDVTGAIADTVNRTLDELRFLVGRINQAAAQVAEASMIASEITAALLQASEQQSREIRSTGQKVLSMSTQIQEASRSASASAQAARASLDAAERGAAAVQDQIAGMQGIREQIQNTAKRVKRLGESSQEIGEIVEMISDIAERTHVLALNAAIQAASAGESRRGFTVVAEEVQRLADRTADAARQIGTLIHAIQLDTHDAVAAMERSTQDVVKGAKLSDAAGTSLVAIGRVTRQVTDLIESVARTTEAQAHSATDVASSIERILAVTDDTSEGTRRTAGSIGTLASLAQELKASVARFRVE